MRILAILVIFPALCFAGIEKDVVTENRKDGRPLIRTTRVTSSGELVYQAVERLDQKVFGEGTASVEESFYATGRLLASIRRFPNGSEVDIYPVDDFVVRVTQRPPLRLLAISKTREKSLIWDQDEADLRTVFKEHSSSNNE